MDSKARTLAQSPSTINDEVNPVIKMSCCATKDQAYKLSTGPQLASSAASTASHQPWCHMGFPVNSLRCSTPSLWTIPRASKTSTSAREVDRWSSGPNRVLQHRRRSSRPAMPATEAARASSECCRRQTSACQRDLAIDQTMTAQHLRQQHLRHTRFVRGQAGCASGLQAVSRFGSCKAPAPRSATLQDQREINVNHCFVPPPD